MNDVVKLYTDENNQPILKYKEKFYPFIKVDDFTVFEIFKSHKDYGTKNYEGKLLTFVREYTKEDVGYYD